MQRNTTVLVIKLSFAGPINTTKCFLGHVPVLAHLSSWCKVIRLWMGKKNNWYFSALELLLLNMEMSEGEAESWCISVHFVVVTRLWKFFSFIILLSLATGCSMEISRHFHSKLYMTGKMVWRYKKKINYTMFGSVCVRS